MTKIMSADKNGTTPLGYIGITDCDGLRHVIRVGAIQMLSDGDLCRDVTMAVVAGRALAIPVPLDQLLGQLDQNARRPIGR